MTRVTFLLLAAGLAFAGPAAGAAPDSLPRALSVEVPFVAQGPLLCGGAAAAMVERFWGARGVYAEDFASLVRPVEGGIHGKALAAALSHRGYVATVHLGEPGLLRATLASGAPLILLLDADGRALHYVVAVGLDGDTVRLHDPALGPSRAMARPELMRRWARADHWALVVRPARGRLDAGREAGAAGDDPPTAPPSPAVSRGIASLRAGDRAAARRAAREALGVDPSDPLAWRLLATARYLDGDAVGALRAWNRIDAPRLDLLVIEGLHGTRDPALRAFLDLPHDRPLRADAFRLARRRLHEVPAVASGRLHLSTLPDGSVEATAQVFEPPRWPTGRVALASAAAGAGLERRVLLSAGPWLGSGDRVTLGIQWQQALSIGHLALRTLAPPLPGVVGVTLDGRRMRVDRGAGPPEVDERLHAGIETRTWIRPSVRLRVAAGLDRWTGLGRLATGSVGLHLALAGDHLTLEATATGWAGSTAFSRGALRARARLPAGELGAWRIAWRLDGGVAAASADAPPLAWWTAGTGRLGDIPLRGHPAVRDDAVRGPAFGRALAHASVEPTLLRRLGPVRFGGALFLDAARAWQTPLRATTPLYLDAGAGLRVELGTHRWRVDVARGGGRWVLSAQAGAPIG